MATPHWLSGSDALALVLSLDKATDAIRHLITLCADRVVSTQCRRWVVHDPTSPQYDENDTGLIAIDYTFWADPELKCDWERSVFEVNKYDPFGSMTTRARDVEFRGDQIVGQVTGAKFEDCWPIPASGAEVSAAPPPIKPLNPPARFHMRPAVGGISPPPAKEGPGVRSPRPPRQRGSGRPAKRRAPDRGRPVTDADVQRWFANLTPAEQKLGVLKLWALALEHFAPRWAVRKQFEPFGNGRGVGRPRNI